jgi:ankyrin repeat protein
LPEHFEWRSALAQSAYVTEPATSVQTPLSIAYEKGLYDGVALLLDKVQKEAEAQLASGMQVDVACSDGVTPLHLACLHGDMATAALLICKGVGCE